MTVGPNDPHTLSAVVRFVSVAAHDSFACRADRVEAAHSRDVELQREMAEPAKARRLVLLDEAVTAENDEIGVSLRRSDLRGPRDIFSFVGRAAWVRASRTLIPTSTD